MNEFDIHFNGRPDDLHAHDDAPYIVGEMHGLQGTSRDGGLTRDRVDGPHRKRAVAVGGISGDAPSLTGTGDGARISTMTDHVLDLVGGRR